MHSSSESLAWGDLQLLLAVCRAGSLSGAARRLGVNHSTVFRRVNAIEAATQVRFFERLPTGYRMTEAGEAAFIHAERIENEVHALGREVLGQDLRLRGRVRVTAPVGMTALMLPPLVVRFAAAHPEVTLDLSGTASALDLNRREAEVAIRATRKPPEFALGRRICRFQFGIYASHERAEAIGGAPIHEQDWVMLTGMESWLVPHLWKREAEGRERASMASEDILSVVNMTAAGGGVTLLPYYLGEPHQGLTRIQGPLEWLTLDLWVLTHPDLKRTARVKAVMDYLYDELKAQRAVFEGA